MKRDTCCGVQPQLLKKSKNLSTVFDGLRKYAAPIYPHVLKDCFQPLFLQNPQKSGWIQMTPNGGWGLFFLLSAHQVGLNCTGNEMPVTHIHFSVSASSKKVEWIIIRCLSPSGTTSGDMTPVAKFPYFDVGYAQLMFFMLLWGLTTPFGVEGWVPPGTQVLIHCFFNCSLRAEIIFTWHFWSGGSLAEEGDWASYPGLECWFRSWMFMLASVFVRLLRANHSHKIKCDASKADAFRKGIGKR